MGEQFTKGPWEWDAGVVPPDGPARYADIYTGGGDTIIASFNDLIPEGRANARLIASCPDLVEALREIVRWHIKRGPFDEPLGASEQEPEINAAIAALSRATGEG